MLGACSTCSMAHPAALTVAAVTTGFPAANHTSVSQINMRMNNPATGSYLAGEHKRILYIDDIQ